MPNGPWRPHESVTQATVLTSRDTPNMEDDGKNVEPCPESKNKNMAPTNCSQSFSGHVYVLFLDIRGLVPKLLNDLS